MHSSFQSTTYNHSLQGQILGPSSLKIFAGEDLSKDFSTKPVAIARDSNKSSQIFGGGSKSKKNSGG